MNGDTVGSVASGKEADEGRRRVSQHHLADVGRGRWCRVSPGKLHRVAHAGHNSRVRRAGAVKMPLNAGVTW